MYKLGEFVYISLLLEHLFGDVVDVNFHLLDLLVHVDHHATDVSEVNV